MTTQAEVGALGAGFQIPFYTVSFMDQLCCLLKKTVKKIQSILFKSMKKDSVLYRTRTDKKGLLEWLTECSPASPAMAVS